MKSCEFVLFNLVIIFILSLNAEENERPFITSGIPEPPICFKENGKIVGIEIEILDSVFKELKLPVKHIIIESSTREKYQCKKGRIDIVRTESYKKSRSEFAYYPKESHMNISWNFFIRKKDQDKIVYEDFKDLTPYRIGVTEGYAYTPEFWKAIKSKSFREIQYVTQNHLNYDKLLNGRIDVFPAPKVIGLYNFSKKTNGKSITYIKKPFKDKPYYNIFCKKSTHPKMQYLRDNYDIVLKKLKEKGVVDNILRKYGFK